MLRQNSSGLHNNNNNHGGEQTMQKMTLNFEYSNKQLDQIQLEQMQLQDEQIQDIRNRIHSTFDDLEKRINSASPIGPFPGRDYSDDSKHLFLDL